MRDSQFYIGIIFVFLGSLTAGFITGRSAERREEKELSKVIDWNTKHIHSLGVNSAVEKQNAELLIQILNLLEGNETKAVPKNVPLGMLINDGPIEDDDVPHTFEQVNQDQQEVDRGIRAAANNNLFQNKTLHNILERLKDSII
jgi:hypothetical protein